MNPAAGSKTLADTRRTLGWILTTAIAAFLAAIVAGWWLYRGEGSDQAQARQLPIATVAQHAATRTTTELRDAAQRQRELTDALERNLAAAKRENENEAGWFAQ